MLLENPFPTDIRVQKEADALIAAGHNLILLCPLEEGEKKRDFFHNIQIIRFNGQDHGNFLKRKLLLCYQALTFRQLSWLKVILEVVKEKKIDTLHVHDLLLMETAAAVKKKTGVPIVADLHENYPELLRIRFNPNELFWKDRLLVGANRWAKHEPKMLKKADHIIVVVEEAMERLVSLGLPSNKISVVSNSEANKYWESYAIDKSIVDKYKDSFVVSYIGGFGPHRGLDTAIKAMSAIKQKGTDIIKLLLVGAGGWYGNLLAKLVDKEGISDWVEFVPWIPITEVRSFIEASNIGIVPHNSTAHTENTVPHKLFQYMLFEKPVIVSSCRPLKRIVSETNSGLVFQAGDPDDLAEKIIELYNSYQLRKKLGRNGKNAADSGKYSWSNQEKELLRAYRMFKFSKN
jgi:glycosyltransferase involved in cell wall biosynthesis